MCKPKLLLVLLASAPLWVLTPAPAAFADDAPLTESEKADILREAAKLKAKSHLVRPDVDTDDLKYLFGLSKAEEDEIRYDILTEQIERLSQVVRALRMRERLLPPPLPRLESRNRNLDNIAAIHGSKGPTAKSVRLILEYRLMIIDNPRLKVGEIIEDPDKVVAHVVTMDGSLVDKFTVDKRTGAWTTIR